MLSSAPLAAAGACVARWGLPAEARACGDASAGRSAQAGHRTCSAGNAHGCRLGPPTRRSVPGPMRIAAIQAH